MPDLDALLAVAHRLADAARPETLRHFRATGLAVEDKGGTGDRPGFDPVTEADRAAERAIRDLLAELRPHDAILGEEYGESPGTSGITWILDPIDGTRGYMSGTPTWGTLIAASRDGRPILGLVDQPFIGERFTGGGGQARYDGPHGTGPLRTAAPRELSRATLFTTFPEIGTEADRAAFARVSGAARLTRYGMDCYAYALVAAGQADLVIEAGLAPYDIAAPLALVEAAGGIVTDWSGGDAAGGGRVIAAANAQVHAAALALLRG